MLNPRRTLSGVDRVRVDQLTALVLLTVDQLQIWNGGPSHLRILRAFGGVLFSAPVAVRRRWPLAGMLVILAASAANVVLHYGGGGQQPIGVLPALLLIVYGMGAYAPWRRSRWVMLLTLVIPSINTLQKPGQGWSNVIVAAVVFLAAYAVGRMVRVRSARERAEREQAERLDAERELSAATVALKERARIARELHDVIAHSVSVMVIQAGGARLVMDAEPERAEASLRIVERAGREALAEMRRLLGVLDGEHDPRALAPQPGLADIHDLVSRARASGLVADLHVDGEQPTTISPALDLCAYRIVQEALTNAIKHAAPARAEVHVHWGERELELEICDDGRGPDDAGKGSGGHGIAGMRERVALHGGSIGAGAGARGGFTVRASLPLAREAVR